jgi:uroporphyrinogen-III synthase
VPEGEQGRLLITRSEPGASALAAALEAGGYRTVVCPMVEIEPRRSPENERLAVSLDRFDVVICLSATAVEHGVPLLARHWPAMPGSLRWVAIGRATARALGKHGLVADVPQDETSEGLLALPVLAAPAGLRVLVLCGEGGRTLLADTLSARGADVRRLECYRRRPPAAVPLEEAGAEPAQIEAIVVSSGEAADLLAQQWHAAGGAPNVLVVAPSARVANVLREHGFARIRVSDGASADAVLAALCGD